MARQNSYIKLMEKGKVHEGIVIKVSDVPDTYHEKKLWNVIIRDPKEISKDENIIESDFLAQEIVAGDSKMAQLIGHKVKFVIINPGDGGNKLAWVKLDEVQSLIDVRDKISIARDSFKIAADLIIAGKAEAFVFKNIDQLATRVADQIINLSKNI